jgi:hypothetical protein
MERNFSRRINNLTGKMIVVRNMIINLPFTFYSYILFYYLKHFSLFIGNGICL